MLVMLYTGTAKMTFYIYIWDRFGNFKNNSFAKLYEKKS